MNVNLGPGSTTLGRGALYRYIPKAVIGNLLSPMSGCEDLHLPSGGSSKQRSVAGR